MVRRPYRSLPLCESSQSLDVRRMHRDGQLEAGETFSYSWSCGGEPFGSIGVLTEGYSIVLTFSVRRSEDSQWKSIEQRVPVVWTRCHYGRSRPWFRCSAYSNGQLCGRRVAVIYCAGESFACRHCYCVSYASQHEALGHRGLGKARKIRMRLGGSASLCDEFPEKPVGMHWQTYDRLCRAYDIAADRSMVGLSRYLERDG